MYVYKYMAGYVETLIGVEEKEYDPHKHRKIINPTTYMETMIHFLKANLGAGLLAMPNAVSRMGILVGPLGIFVIGIFTVYCLILLVGAQYEVCKKYRCGYMTYHKTIRIAVHDGPPWFRWAAPIFGQGTDIIMLFWQIGVCAIYCVFVCENLKQVLDAHEHETSLRLLIAYLLPIVLVMSMVKDLKLLTPFSTVSNVCIMIGLCFTFFYIIEEDVMIEPNNFGVKGLLEIPVFIGITLFAVQAVGVVLALEYNMENPKEFGGVCGLLSIGMAITTVIYAVLGVFGYLRFGSDSKGSVTLNLPPGDKKAQAAKLTFAMALFLSYPLQNLVAWQIVWRKIQKKSDSKITDYILRALCGCIPVGLAVAAPTLGPFMGLAGALCLSLLAIIFPAIMDLCIYYPNRYGYCRYKVYVDLFIILFGIFCCISGVYTSLLEMADEISKED